MFKQCEDFPDSRVAVVCHPDFVDTGFVVRVEVVVHVEPNVSFRVDFAAHQMVVVV